MDFKTLEKKIIKNAMSYGKNNHIIIDQHFAVVKLFEEVGEFAQALLIHQQKCRPRKIVSIKVSRLELGKELADVVSLAIVNAHLLGIDLEAAIDKKWIHKEQ